MVRNPITTSPKIMMAKIINTILGIRKLRKRDPPEVVVFLDKLEVSLSTIIGKSGLSILFYITLLICPFTTHPTLIDPH